MTLIDTSMLHLEVRHTETAWALLSHIIAKIFALSLTSLFKLWEILFSS